MSNTFGIDYKSMITNEYYNEIKELYYKYRNKEHNNNLNYPEYKIITEFLNKNAQYKQNIEPYSDQGVILKCKCGNKKKIKKINHNTRSNLMYCDKCYQDISKDYGKLTNNLIFAAKKNIFNYFRGNKKCTVCNDSVTRLFLRDNNGTYKKELTEKMAANEINFIKKIIESIPRFNQQNNLRFIYRYIKDLNQRIEYNMIYLGETFNDIEFK